uniref:putative ATP-dependent RNA helicase TDRD12 isoform X1 n=2 Tax=Gasterosteus aculeatus aculeatus TaxID=481459 RepID=UPI001A98913F|nr:putative ATP-dependent RNA helicase TDRD12 isoform X1 [Gasterosteus aculeatus aculeatus]
MVNISILRIESPSCIWGRFVQDPGSGTDQYDQLQAQMNLFYKDVTRDLRQLKPTSLEEGQVCVVYWSWMKSWCRAVVESIVMDSVSSQTRCLLVDQGERLIVASDHIRIALPTFLQLPFWVRKFHLAGIKPTTLRVTVYEESAKLVASSKWDGSATLYLHRLLQASTMAEAVMLESESDSTSLELYLTVWNVKICVNDDLVAKKYAYYSGGQNTVMLSSSLFNQSICSTSNKPAPQTSQPPPALSPRFDSVEHPAAPSTPQKPQHEPQTSEGGTGSKVTRTAAESDSMEETNASLALLQFRFLNPGSVQQQAAPAVSQHEELRDGRPDETTAASSRCTGQEVDSDPATRHTSRTREQGVGESCQVGCLADGETSDSRSAERTQRKEEEWACSRLLEWLNPKPPIADPEAADAAPPDCPQVAPHDPSRSGALVHSALPVEPCSGLDDAPVTNTLRWAMKSKQYGALSPADRYSWTAVARGCNTVIVSHNADQPLAYLAPLLTHILLNSIFSLTSGTGPIVVLLCQGWKKAQVVYGLLEDMKVAPVLHPLILLLGVGKNEAKAVKIPKDCLLLVTTPFSLVRLLSSHCFLFLRLCHLVLDEADRLFTVAPDQMAAILEHFQKETASCSRQLVAVAKKWTGHMEGLVANYMPYPCIVVTVPEEAVLYGNVQQVVLMTLESSKISVLLGALDFNPVIGQKTVIVADSAEEVEDVWKAVSSKSAFCLKTHERLTHNFDFVIEQWGKAIGPGTHVILVTTTQCLKSLGVRDASCVVHYDFPASPKLFGGRLSCMAKNFRNLSERGSSEDQPRLTRSVLLISERNTSHMVGVVGYLERTVAPLPPELLSFVRGVQLAQEDHKADRPLCSYLKSFGVCRDRSVCPNRHRFIPKLDESLLPSSGLLEVLPLHVKTASVFYGRLVEEGGGGFQSLAAEMSAFYADKKPGAEEVLQGGLYAVQEHEVFHRVEVLSPPLRADRLFFSVFVRFIDVGNKKEVKSHQVLQLPERFCSLPGQAVEMVVCRVKPSDGEIDWHPEVTRAISQKIQGLQHRARAVFSLGNTVFVDPMVRLTQVPGMKTVINECSVQAEILNTGMGVTNQEHLDLLRALRRDAEEAGHTSKSGDAAPSLEVGIKVEVLAEAFRAAEVDPLAELPPLELIPECGQTPSPDRRAAVGQKSLHTADLKSAEQTTRIQNGREPPAAHLGKGEHQSDDTNEEDSGDPPKIFHPLARWYQTSSFAIVTVKLRNPENQRCDFYPDRVVYSGRADGRTYRADLQLHGDVVADRCCWEMKSNEPVLRLVKQQPGHWERLLRSKNIFVSYDTDHIEEDEDGTPNGPCFVEDLGKDNWYVNLESGSESD